MERRMILVIAIAVVLSLCIGIAFYFWHKDQEKDAEAKYALLEEITMQGGLCIWRQTRVSMIKQEIPMILS
ncbi:hypothetical protein CHH61_22435 [Shouchella clausii]|jgi:uncharacterized protein HemX|uniref:Uncharacterized protein n=1 Tax=Shouchella clausii TaxID=79880 RepID=A0A268RU25_SHOCL|nr:hypothetical protein CHH61_22435 [Shouchella clausii]